MENISGNNDWVIFTLLAVGSLFLVIFQVVQRGTSVLKFLIQEKEEAQNVFLNWVLISIGFMVLVAVLWSQYIPVVPRFFEDLEWNGLVLNKIGVMLTVFFLFYFIKNLLTLVFYISVGQMDKYLLLVFVAQKFYFVESLWLMGVCVLHYYFSIDRNESFIYYAGGMIFFLMVKNLIYIFHKSQPLPEEWYYKILYICTLQILPQIVVWKFIFLA